ncbi:hypothetical protein HK096_002167, partial [Nowakowskiella sp. JEL0078]
MQKRDLICILPLLLGEKDPMSDKNVKFSDFSTDSYPDELHLHEESPKQNTVRQTLKEIFKLQGTQ